MNKNKKSHGFTLIELLVVIATLATITAIGYVSYAGIAHRSATNTVKVQLSQTSEALEIARLETFAYPSSLPSSVPTNPDIVLSYTSHNIYGNLSAVQNGVLFHTICQELVSEGLGKGVDQGGGTNDYITGCHVYNYPQIQVHGWDSKTFSTPVTQQNVIDYANSLNYTDSWHHNQTAVSRNFYLALADRFAASGGSFPVTTFWDPWANPGNGGVMHVALGAPTSSSNAWLNEDSYCIEAYHTRFPLDVWSIHTEGESMTDQPCQP